LWGPCSKGALQQRTPYSAKGACLTPSQGTKHEFSALFSRGQEARDGQPKGTLALLREAMGRKPAPPPSSVEQQKHR